MTTFDDREHAFESHFAFEEELDFKAKARGDRLVAVWAGELMGLQGPALESYVLSVMHADLQDPGGEEVYHKVVADLTQAGVAIRPQEVRERISRLAAEGRMQVGADLGADRVPGV